MANYSQNGTGGIYNPRCETMSRENIVHVLNTQKDRIAELEQQTEAQRAMLERIIDQCKPIFQMRGSVMIATHVLDEARKVLATAQQEE